MRWLVRYYGTPASAGTPSLPEVIDFHHPLGDIERMIQLLNLFKWQVPPQDILAMPDAWADDLLLAHTCGWIVEKQTEKEND